ncbi:hypothetical protein FD755_013302 [Muntiacus reevesi]|uniref:Polypeptide N-acetylgalactosaminyltransferase n=1 Tax=Muntiacus reevesi TaxID=9886 RepID=A0A5N3XNA9_MUNRE|nr:hypothetical protein FD755_013302 [Muntiacus reevesi]
MRKFAYYQMVLATFWIWVLLDMFLLIYFSECNKCDEEKRERTSCWGCPGEMGKPVIIPKEDQEKMKEMFKINQFNLMASEIIALHRSLPDARFSSAWSILLQTVHSIINHLPRHMLEEIVLVDDAKSYVKKLKVPVHIIQMEQRSGLIRARLRGAAVSQGEPLLARIKHDRRTVVCPIIDVISDDTFECMAGSDMTYGVFNWKLQFRWYHFPQREMDRRKGDQTSCENTIWQCGRTLVTVTCSRVGRVFRKATPCTFSGGRVSIKITDDLQKCVTKVDYGTISSRLGLRHKLECRPFSLYLENIHPDSQISHQYFSLGEIQNVETNQCLDNTARKEIEKVFSYIAKKEIKTDDLCLDVSKLNDPVTMLKCHHLKGSQLREYDPCLDKATDEDSHVSSIRDCNGSRFQQWLL